MLRLSATTICLSLCLFSAHPTYGGDTPTAALYGPLGLNTVPSARHDDSGTIRFFSGYNEPYLHAGISAQITDGLNMSLRQSGETTALGERPDRFYPGIDLKLRLTKEDTITPEISLGMISAFGHRRTAGEYLAASKRFKNFDLTGGVAWGRLASAAHTSNPFRILGDHFDKHRDISSEDPNDFEDWFTGKDIGFFGGIEYFTPIKGLSVKADFGADDYIIEQISSDHNPPEPWSAGINYQPVSWADIGIATVGGEQIMGQINISSPLLRWPGRNNSYDAAVTLNTERNAETSHKAIEKESRYHGILLSSKHAPDTKTANGYLQVRSHDNTTQLIGRAIRSMNNHSGTDIEEFSVQPAIYGLKGPTIKLRRKDVENAFLNNHGSAQEIWYGAEFDTSYKQGSKSEPIKEQDSIISTRSFRIFLDQDVSLAEEDSGALFRTSAVISKTSRFGTGGITGHAVRFSLIDNLDRIEDIRPISPLPVRSDIERFAQNGIILDQSYVGWTHTFKPGLYAAFTGGYLEQMYGGAGGELLYRPFGKTYAIGAETYLAFKRDPDQYLGMGFTGDTLMTGHVHGYYEFPGTQTTLHASAGRYLAEDIGATLSLSQNFGNDAYLEAFVTATDNADFDLFGSTTHLYSGMKLNLPIGNIPYIPNGSQIRVNTAPIGRDTGQALNKPIELYDVTERLSYRYLSAHWNSILK